MKQKFLKYNTRDFIRNVGRKPEQDDLERANCEHAGKLGHQDCGVCLEHNKPIFCCVDCFQLAQHGLVERL